ncbi:MAG: hypothetical protein AAGU21_13725 [Solidesulfovibrio sp.]|uniref:hypothetical protein n=1 Tax=Solidesulfovibrio sp. TaxID=2910990 RepID=UPI002B1FE301|nr:hypothetical protein [Solidesulfovibrio sp.]MEA4857746.1 hypothetical protein [Solidesulfovibrio sp.]
MAYIPKIDPVKIDPIDLGEIKKENTLAAMYDQRQQDMAYEGGARNALNAVLKANPNATGQNVLADMASQGFGEAGQKYAYNWMNRQHSALQYETDLRKEVSNIIGSVTDEASKGRAIDYLQQAFPHASAQFEQFRSVPWQEARSQGNTFALGAAGRVTQERQDAALKSQGFAPGQDPSTLHTIESMRNAADANTRGWNADARAAGAESREMELQPGRVQQQGATLEHTQASTDALKNKQQIVYGPDPTDWRGKRKVPGIVVPGENGGPGTFVPLQGVQGQQQAGDETDGQQAYVQRGNGQILTPAIAARYKEMAGGDRAKAEWLAKYDGWTW